MLAHVSSIFWCTPHPEVRQAKDGRVGARPNHDDKEKDVDEAPQEEDKENREEKDDKEDREDKEDKEDKEEDWGDKKM